MFQSAPGLEAGRCYRLAVAAATVREFQSAPGLEAGRCDRRFVVTGDEQLVSIRARP